MLNDFAYVSGGASHIALSSALALAERGHDVTVFSAVGPIMQKLTPHRNLRVVCTNQHEIAKDPNRFRAAKQGIWNSKAAKMFARLLQGRDPRRTVVHMHVWSKALSSSVVREAIDRDFQVVLSLHDYFIGCPNGGFFIYPRNQICPLRGMSARCVRTNCDPRNYIHKLWRVSRQAVQSQFGLIPKGIEHFIVNTDFSYQRLKSYIPSTASIHFVDNPINIRKEAPAKVHKNTAFVAVGRLTKAKGSQLLAEASRQLGSKTVFVGDGEYRDLISSTNPEATITGWISPQEVIKHLAKARALVFPSMWYEVQPLVIWEAAALGVPAIVSDSCAARDMVENGVTGLLFRGGDVDDLARKIAVLQDANVARNMGAAAYKRYWANPATVELHASRLEKVYAQILR